MQIACKREATMSEQRLVEIETKLAHQEHMTLELNQVVTDQQAKIMQLEELCNSLIERVRAVAETVGDSETGDQPPPHY